MARAPGVLVFLAHLLLPGRGISKLHKYHHSFLVGPMPDFFYFSVETAAVKVTVHVFESVVLSDPTDCSPPSFPVLEGGGSKSIGVLAIPFSRESSQPRDQTWVSCIAGKFFTV